MLITNVGLSFPFLMTLQRYITFSIYANLFTTFFVKNAIFSFNKI